jgi:hypothetical protein
MKNTKLVLIYDEENQPTGWFSGDGQCDNPKVKITTTEDPDYLNLIKKLEQNTKDIDNSVDKPISNV